MSGIENPVSTMVTADAAADPSDGTGADVDTVVDAGAAVAAGEPTEASAETTSLTDPSAPTSSGQPTPPPANNSNRPISGRMPSALGIATTSSWIVGKLVHARKKTRRERALSAVSARARLAHRWAMESFWALCSFTLLAICAAPPAIGVLLFSGMGYGEQLYRWLRAHEALSNKLLAGGLCLLLLLYLLDFSSWGRIADPASRRRWRLVKQLATVLMAIAFTFGLQFRAKAWPAMPPATFMLAVPFFYWAMKRVCYPALHADKYLAALSVFKLATAVGLSGYWFCWVLMGIPGTQHDEPQYWNLATKAAYYARFECAPHGFNLSCAEAMAIPAHAGECTPQCGGGGGGNATTTTTTTSTGTSANASTAAFCAFSHVGNTDLRTERSDCLAAFLQWVFPFVIAMYELVLAVATHFISRSLHRYVLLTYLLTLRTL